MCILLYQFVVFFTYTTDFMSTPRLSFPAPPRDVISIRVAIRRNLELLGEGRTPWLRNFAASAHYLGNPEDLLKAAVYFCALEGVRLDVPGEQFLNPIPSAPPPTQTKQTIPELLRQVEAQGSALENLTKKLEVVGVHGKVRDEQIPTLCWAEFEKPVAIRSKLQWDVRTLDLFHSALMGVPPIPCDTRCTGDWSTSAQGSFPTSEGASGCTDQWVPSAAASNEGEEPMTDMSSPSGDALLAGGGALGDCHLRPQDIRYTVQGWRRGPCAGH